MLEIPSVRLFVRPALRLLWLTAFVVTAGFSAVIHGQARIETDTEGWDFGKVDQGYKDSRIVKIKNIGDKDLVIRRVGVTCGCVDAKIAAKVLAPGKSTELTVTLDTLAVSGQLKKYVFVDSNDPRMSKLMMPVHGEVLAGWWVTPNNLNFGRVDREDSPSKTFRIHLNPRKDVKVMRVYCDSHSIEIERKPFKGEDGNRGFDVTARLKPGREPGNFHAKIHIWTNYPARQRYHVSAFATVTGDLIINPTRLGFGGIKRGASRTLTVEIKKKRGGPLALTRIDCTDDQIKTKIEEIAKGRHFKIAVTLTPTTTKNRVVGRLYVRTDDPNQPTVMLVYVAGVRRR